MTSSQKRRIWFENFSQAFQTLLSHKFRSLLTVLGVFIGVVTVVVVASIITGMRNKLVDMIESYGTHNIYAFHLNTGVQVGRRSRKEWERKPLKLDYIKPILTRCDSVEDVAYQLFVRRLNVGKAKFRGEEYRDARLEGISINYQKVTNLVVDRGRLLTELDDEHRLMNCLIGDGVAEALYPGMNPVGRELNLAGKQFTVVGVIEKTKATFFGDGGNDNNVFIPYQTLKKLSPQDDWNFFLIQAKPGQVDRAIDQVEQTLRVERKVKTNEDSDFSLSSADSIIKQFDALVAGIGLFCIFISAIGLIVGGVGVMNIMLVSVRERTREIGVRKAIGAKKRDITTQFLIEAMTLTGAGGVIGIIFSVLTGILLTALVPSLPATIPAWAVIMAFLVSVFIGLVFGVWPARRASRLDPIECLRYE